MDMIRIPRKFYDDHEERQLDTPKALRETKTHIWIDRADPVLPELLSDADFYSEIYGLDLETARWICPAARALLKAVR